jgi:hypothetical protein
LVLIYYDIALIYPLIAAIIVKLTFNSPLYPAIKQAYYLFIGYFLAYAAIMLIVLSTTKFVDPIINIIIFTIGFFAVFFIRAYIQTEQHDIFAAIETPKDK